MKYLLLACAMLCACNEPRRINDGAVLPVTVIMDHDMERVAGPHAPGTYVRGCYAVCPQPAIYLLAGGEEAWTLAHEIGHRADSIGGNYAQAIRDITPINPTPEFAARLRVCWEIERAQGGYWKAIYQRWGKRAVNHAEILARVEL